jgi:RNA polymerase sigma-70 factor (ECF subfamily)
VISKKKDIPNQTEKTDEELLRLYRETDCTEYFGQLYNRYIALVYGVCLKYLKDEEKARDAVMNIFEFLLGRVALFHIHTFRTWLYSVVKNHCLSLLIEKKREIKLEFQENFMESDAVLSLLSEEEEDDELKDVLNKCLEKLPKPQKTSIELFFYEEFSYVDIVDNTGYNLKSVKSYIQNGKRNLKICIEKRTGKI